MTASANSEAVAEKGPLILFDGVCNLCSGLVRFLAARDKDGVLWYAPMQSQTGQMILQRHSLPKADYDSFVFLEDGRVYLKSDAFFRVLKYLGAPWPLLRIGMILPAPIANWFYDRIARNRYELFGKKDVCMLPAADVAPRFLK